MKILQIGKYYPPYRGGMETHLYNLCMELSKNVDVEVIVANDNRKTVIEHVEGIPVTRVGRMANLFSTDICPGFIPILRKQKADIVHIHLPNPLAEISSYFLKNGHKLVVTYQSDIIRQKALLKIYKHVLRKFLSKADKILVHSKEYSDSSLFLEPHSDKIEIVPLGIDVDLYKKTDRIEKLSADITNKHGDNIILFIGRLIYYKGVEYLIEAMKNVNGKLIIIGEGPLKKNLTDKVNKLSLTDKVYFANNVSEEDKVAWLHAASLFCLPSVEKSEAFGIVQIEAMACSTPVVNTDIKGSGVTSVSLHNETGFTTPPRDPRALSEAITMILNDQSLREKFSSNCRERVMKYYNKQDTGERVLKIYQDLL